MWWEFEKKKKNLQWKIKIEEIKQKLKEMEISRENREKKIEDQPRACNGYITTVSSKKIAENKSFKNKYKKN